MTSLRTLLNVAYAYLARGKDEKGLRELDEILEQEPRPIPKGRPATTERSRGMQDLMKVMGLPAMVPPPRKPQPQEAAA